MSTRTIRSRNHSMLLLAEAPTYDSGANISAGVSLSTKAVRGAMQRLARCRQRSLESSQHLADRPSTDNDRVISPPRICPKPSATVGNKCIFVKKDRKIETYAEAWAS